MLDIWTVLLFIIVLVLVKLYRTGRRPSCMPSGPDPWPFIGNLDLIYSSNRFHMVAQELGRKYNGMFSKLDGSWKKQLSLEKLFFFHFRHACSTVRTYVRQKLFFPLNETLLQMKAQTLW